MSAQHGRTVSVKWNGTTVAGVRTKSLSIAGSPVDVTNDDDAGVRKLLAVPGQVDVSISVSGIVLNNTLRTASLSASSRIANAQFLAGGFEGSPTNTQGISGDFFLASYKETGEYQGARTFEAEFQSAGAITEYA